MVETINRPETRSWRDGDSVWHRGRFGTVTYITDRAAQLLMDDDSRRVALLEELERPDTTAVKAHNYVTHQVTESKEWGPLPDLDRIDL